MSVSDEIYNAVLGHDAKTLRELLRIEDTKMLEDTKIQKEWKGRLSVLLRRAVAKIADEKISQDQQIRTAQLLLAHGADVNYSGFYSGYSPALHRAGGSGVQEFLVMHGADVNAVEVGIKYTPLHQRCTNISYDAASVLLLLKHKADPMAKDWKEKTPFYSLCCNIYAYKVRTNNTPFSEDKELKELLEVIESYLQNTKQEDIENLIASLFERVAHVTADKLDLEYWEGNPCYASTKVPAMQALFSLLLSHLNRCTLSEPPLSGILALRNNAALLLGEGHSLLEKLNHLKEKSPSA